MVVLQEYPRKVMLQVPKDHRNNFNIKLRYLQYSSIWYTVYEYVINFTNLTQHYPTVPFLSVKRHTTRI